MNVSRRLRMPGSVAVAAFVVAYSLSISCLGAGAESSMPDEQNAGAKSDQSEAGTEGGNVRSAEHNEPKSPGGSAQNFGQKSETTEKRSEETRSDEQTEKKSGQKAEKKSGEKVDKIREKTGKGEGREGNWRQGTQGSPSLKTGRKRVNKNPSSADAHNDLGWALRQHHELKEAETELRKALELDETIPWGHSNLSVVLLDTNRVDEAVKEAERAVGIDEKAPVYHVVYGNALAAKGSYDDAIKQYAVAVKLRPDYENALYNLGRVLHLKGKNAEAESVLSQALKLDPNDPRVLGLLDKLVKLRH